MKELSIEEKAKAYDFSLKRAKRLYEQGTITESLSYVFPQLKKLGDGEVRKEIMQLIQGMHDADPRKERWLAWLEKQTPAVDTKVIIPKFRVGDIVKSKSQPMLSPSKITSIGKDCYYCDDGCIGFAWEDDCEIVEQKPVISDDALREGIAHFGITQYQIDNWLKKYVDVEKQGEQKPQRMISAEAKEAMYGKPAWSEEDEKMVNNILTPLAGRFPWNIYQPMYDWLKSLKDRIGG